MYSLCLGKLIQWINFLNYEAITDINDVIFLQIRCCITTVVSCNKVTCLIYSLAYRKFLFIHTKAYLSKLSVKLLINK